jgi:hypothetical protein
VEGEYDIYVGMIGPRFGTQTPRLGSGTEEEFERACECRREQPSSMRILFYFKTSSNTVQDIDLQQLAKVQAFRKRISRSVFYSDFKTTDEFLMQVRDHLWGLVARHWKDGKWSVSDPPSDLPKPPALARVMPQGTLLDPSSSTSVPDLGNNEEGTDAMGILDAVVEAHESMQAGFAALDRITSATSRSGQKLEEHAKRITAFTAQASMNPKGMKAVVNAAADDISSYARELRAEIPAFVAGFASAFSNMETSIAMWIREGQPSSELPALNKQLQAAVLTIRASPAPVVGFRDIILSYPPLTSHLRKAVRLTTTQLDELIAGITVISDRAASLLDRLPAAAAGTAPRPG